ncbi:GatB/YqeY domain-containing protein [Geminicoccus harenae]|uniref:GatB/YqeY domain-containing protein n=1 Tax=Geminicoccus harenae TaxID=2498453 RepID=UPI00168A7E80|nr:GatB/YqeY domain-containing protein [Geminicoccus harenae]
MALFDQLRSDRLAAMKARDEVAKNLLGTLMAAAGKDDKSPDDETVVRTVRAFLKNVEETIGHLAGRDTSVQERERAILTGYLPVMLDEAQTRAEVEAVVAALPERSPRQMGKVMAELKARHGSAIDLKLASPMVKAALEG